ncbi:MAG: hypothetical protein ACRD5G_13600 [Candidatus Acidiferrales bacterium]
MDKVEAIESQVKELSGDEMARFRAWFAEFDGEHWDRQFEADAKAGKLDAVAERALGDHEKAKDQRRETRSSTEAHRG